MSKKTALYDLHVKNGGKIIDFAGFSLPVYFTSIIEEHINVRNNVGVFDVSHMGDILIRGVDATNFLDYILPTKVSELGDFTAKYTAYLNDEGLILDDTIITKFNDSMYLLVPNAATIELIYKWLIQHKKDYGVAIIDRSLVYSSLAVQGPKSLKVINKIIDEDLSDLKLFTTKFVKLKRIETRGDDIIPYNNIFISRTGYTGEDGFELIFQNEYATEIWNELFEYGKEEGIKPIGLGARDTLRLEKGMLLSGQDFNKNRTPLECGISWIINYDHKFIGKEALLMQKETEYQIFRGFTMEETGIPRHGYDVYKDSKKVGIITSGTMSPTLKKGIALGFLDKQIKLNDIVDIDIRGSMKKARVCKPKTVP